MQRLATQQETLNTKMDVIAQTLQARITTVIEVEIGSMRVEVAMLTVKAGVWGAIAGAIPAALLALYFLLNRATP